MSTILKALRRLEKEKTRSDRPLREQVTGLGGDDDLEPERTRRWPILVGGVGAGVIAGTALLLLVIARDEPTPPVAPTAAALAAPTPAAPAAPARAQAPGGRGLIQPIPPGQAPAANPVHPAAPREASPPPIDSDDVQVIDRGAPEPRLAADPAPVAPAAAENEPGSARPSRPVARRRAPAQAPVVAAPPQPRREVAAAEPPVAKAPAVEEPRSAPATPPEVAKAPSSAAPPAAAKPKSSPPPPPPDPFPALRVERTTWHPLAEKRLAVVDVPGQGARELREGDPVAGATVARIEPSGVVFRFDGRDVRRAVGARP